MRSPLPLRSSPVLLAFGGEILFTTRTFSGTRDFSLMAGLVRDFASTAVVFVFAFGFAIMNSLTSFSRLFGVLLRHLISNILLKTFSYTFEWNALEDGIEESFDHDLLRFRLRNATRFQIEERLRLELTNGGAMRAAHIVS